MNVEEVNKHYEKRCKPGSLSAFGVSVERLSHHALCGLAQELHRQMQQQAEEHAHQLRFISDARGMK